VPARFNLALLLQQQGRHRRALRQLKRLLGTAPDHAWGHYQAGNELARAGSRKRASKHYASAFRLDPSLLEPAVNPHIVANRLSTRAVLMAFRDAGALSMAPRQYENPGRIAGLLVPRPATPEAAGAEQQQPTKTRRQRKPRKGGDGG